MNVLLLNMQQESQSLAMKRVCSRQIVANKNKNKKEI